VLTQVEHRTWPRTWAYAQAAQGGGEEKKKKKKRAGDKTSSAVSNGPLLTLTAQARGTRGEKKEGKEKGKKRAVQQNLPTPAESSTSKIIEERGRKNAHERKRRLCGQAQSSFFPSGIDTKKGESTSPSSPSFPVKWGRGRGEKETIASFA